METQLAGVIFDLSAIFTKWNLLLIVATWSIIQTAAKMFPRLLDKKSQWNKLMVLLPMVLCTAAMWIPGPWLDEEVTVGERIVFGVFLGALTLNGDKVASKFGLHKFLPSFAKTKTPGEAHPADANSREKDPSNALNDFKGSDS